MSPTQTRAHTLSYLKGYLRACALLNTFVNDCKTYTIDILPKTGDIQSVLRDFYKVKNWVVTTEDLGTEWRAQLEQELRPYFDQIVKEVFVMAKREELYEDGQLKEGAEASVQAMRGHHFLNVKRMVSVFLDELGKLVPEGSSLLKANVNWSPPNAKYEGFYECYAHDFIFDLGGEYLYLHFGSSD